VKERDVKMKKDESDKKNNGEPVEVGKASAAKDPGPAKGAQGSEEEKVLEVSGQENPEAAEKKQASGKDSGGEAASPSGSESTEPDTDTGEEEDASKKLESLARENEQLKKEQEEMEDKHLRLRADFDNFRKRVNKEKANLIQYGNETLLLDLLPVVDNIERILAHSFKESGWEAFREGVELVLTDLRNMLSKYGVQAIEALGKAFDPNLHEAMQRIESDEVSPDTILEEYQKGYLYRERLLRPSRVTVAVAPEEKKEEEAAVEEGSQTSDKGKDEAEEDKKILQ